MSDLTCKITGKDYEDCECGLCMKLKKSLEVKRSPHAASEAGSECMNLLWSDTTPTENGFYWCHQNGKTRMVKVWSDGKYTNEDGGAPVNDAMYEGAKWYGPIEPPPAT